MTAPPGDANGLIRGRLRSWVATAPGERIALVMIVRDEASNLERCLASAVPWVDEMVVVDTGSADATVEIAESFGARVGHFAWCDDFAGARNAALGLATADWVLQLDGDEVLEAETASALRHVVHEYAAHDGATCFALPVRSYWPAREGSDVADAPTVHRGARLFRRLPGVCWVGDVHETVMTDGSWTGPDMEYIDADAPVIDHFGYAVDRETLQRKSARNQSLLEHAYQRNRAGGYYAFKLGQHAITDGHPVEALRWLRLSVAEALAEPRPARFVTSSVEHLARLLMEFDASPSPLAETLPDHPASSGAHPLVDEAVGALRRVLGIYGQATSVWQRLAEASTRLGDRREALRAYRMVLDQVPDQADALLGYASALSDDTPAVMGILDRFLAVHGPRDAVCAWRGELQRSSGDIQQAYDFLYDTLRDHPEFLQTRVTLASLLVDAGAANEALETLAPVVDVPTAPVMMFEILARAFSSLGQVDAAVHARMLASARELEGGGSDDTLVPPPVIASQ